MYRGVFGGQPVHVQNGFAAGSLQLQHVPVESHNGFKAKLELSFELIADTEEKMCHMFGVVKNKIMYGRKVKGIERSTFLIGPDGLLVQEWRGVKVDGHVAEVLKAVRP